MTIRNRKTKKDVGIDEISRDHRAKLEGAVQLYIQDVPVGSYQPPLKGTIIIPWDLLEFMMEYANITRMPNSSIEGLEFDIALWETKQDDHGKGRSRQYRADFFGRVAPMVKNMTPELKEFFKNIIWRPTQR